MIQNPKGYNPVEAEKAYEKNEAEIKAEFGDLNKYIRRIARKVKDYGMTYEAIDNETITFNGHTVKLIDEKGTVSFDGQEMKWSKTEDKIKAARN